MIIKKCNGCGAILQSDDINKPGYVKEVNPDTEFCIRCHRMKHYNELPKIVADNTLYEKVIDDSLRKNGLMILLVDVFDLEGTFIKPIIDKLRNSDVILVANKFDVFPHSTNPTKIVDWLAKACEKIFFRVRAIHIVSAKKGYFLDDLMQNIDEFRRGRDVYLIGCANVGKSSLINAMLRRFTAKTTDLIATSVIPGTTLGSITIPFFDDNKAFIDTPGLINEKNVLASLLPTCYKKILPKNEIKPLTYQLMPDGVLFIGGIAYLRVISGNPCVTAYFSNNLTLHRTSSKRIDDLLANQIGKLLTPPTENDALVTYNKKVYLFDGIKKMDIVISGLGFLAVSGEAKIEFNLMNGVGINVRRAIINGKTIRRN